MAPQRTGWASRAGHVAQFLGFAPTGLEVAWTGAAVSTCADGRIATIRVQGDLDRLRDRLAANAREARHDG